MLVMNRFRGWLGEKRTAIALKIGLDAEKYHLYNNLIIPSHNGTAQIDHLVVSEFGLFIIETKRLKGWIFGSKSGKIWTHVLYNSKYTFQNPLRQTYRQKKVLAGFLGIDESLINDIVKFSRIGRFKTRVPENVLRKGLVRYIRRSHNPVLSLEEKTRIVNIINQHIRTTRLNRKNHIQSLKMRHSSTIKCPSCGASLIERTLKNGPRTGSKFLSCQNYPSCRYTKSIKSKPRISGKQLSISYIIGLLIFLILLIIFFSLSIFTI